MHCHWLFANSFYLFYYCWYLEFAIRHKLAKKGYGLLFGLIDLTYCICTMYQRPNIDCKHAWMHVVISCLFFHSWVHQLDNFNSLEESMRSVNWTLSIWFIYIIISVYVGRSKEFLGIYIWYYPMVRALFWGCGKICYTPELYCNN